MVGVGTALPMTTSLAPSPWRDACEAASECPGECVLRVAVTAEECAPGVHALLSCAGMTGGYRCGAEGHPESPVIGVDAVEWLPACPKNVLWLAGCSCAPDLHDDACATCIKTRCCDPWRAYLASPETSACGWGGSCEQSWPTKSELLACTAAECPGRCR